MGKYVRMTKLKRLGYNSIDYATSCCLLEVHTQVKFEIPCRIKKFEFSTIISHFGPTTFLEEYTLKVCLVGMKTEWIESKGENRREN